MQSILRNFFTQRNIRAFRRRVWGDILSPLRRSADATLLDAGQLSAEGIHRILVLRPNHRLGNILLITPLLAELERLFPGAEIDVLAAGEAPHEVLANFSSVGCIRTLPHYLLRHVFRTVGTILPLRRTLYDLVVNPVTDSHTSRVLVSLMKARNVVRIPPERLNHHANWARIMPSAPAHFATLPVFVLRHALASESGVANAAYPPLDIRLTPAEQHRGRRALDTLLRTRQVKSESVVVGIFANATGGKRYGQEWWIRFLDTLAGHHPGYAIVEVVPADGHSRLGNRFPTYYSSSLRKLASVMANLTCFVSADGGVMHLACASGVPTVGLFSVSDATKYAPYGHQSRSCDTVGKSPEQVAQAVELAIEAITTDH